MNIARKRRKRIGVILKGGYEAFQNYFLRGIMTQAHSLDCDVIVFTMLNELDGCPSFQMGEENICNLINFDELDAIIYANGSFANAQTRNNIDKLLLEKCKVPILCVEEDSKHFPSIFAENIKPVEIIIDHLIEKHNLTKIFFLTGYKGNKQAEERAQGYKKSLERHGIEYDEHYLIYGDYWKESAFKLGNDIADGKIEMPQAVACANDWMAINLCNTLTDRGILVPQDIAIVGFDGIFEAIDNIPSITTYTYTRFGVGVDSVCEVYKKAFGEECYPVSCDYGRLEIGQSCGCEENHLWLMQKRKEYINVAFHYRSLYKSSNMAVNLFSSENLEDFIMKMLGHTFLLRENAAYGLCLCENWDDLEKDDDQTDYLRTGYSEKMRLITNADANLSFNSIDMIPPQFEDRDYPTTFFLTPVHFNDRCFGYSIINYGKDITVFDEVYHDWTMNINNGLEIVRVQNYFKRFNQKLFLSSIRDALTGIYNRKGFNLYSTQIFEKANKENKKLFVLSADLDDLKVINDTYGHLEGDNAIITVARALNSSCDENEICARTGGDEFMVLGCADYDEERISEFIANVNKYIRKYNKNSNKPYEVALSIGHQFGYVASDSSLGEYINESDKVMYLNKAARKAEKNKKPR